MFLILQSRAIALASILILHHLGPERESADDLHRRFGNAWALLVGSQSLHVAGGPFTVPQAVPVDRSARRAQARYWLHRDPIRLTRMWWRGRTARHMFHILPGESILELGSCHGELSSVLATITRGQCSITSSSFLPAAVDGGPGHVPNNRVEWMNLMEFPGPMAGRQFDYVVATCLLDLENGPLLLEEVKKLLRPGGRLLFFEANPWNPLFWLRKQLQPTVTLPPPRGRRLSPASSNSTSCSRSWGTSASP